VIIIYFFDINVKVIFNPGMKFILSPKWCGNKGKEKKSRGTEGQMVGGSEVKTKKQTSKFKIQKLYENLQGLGVFFSVRAALT